MAALEVADGRTRGVGGMVRDGLLGLPVADIDFATALQPAEVISRLERAGLKAVPTGLAHGTVTAVAYGRAIEVTTLRRDIATDGRHAEVAFTDDWRADAARRDFTINALYADLTTGAVTDFFGGLGDLAARRVRFIGDPLVRIAEDHLRILRFFRFHARFGAGPPDAPGLAACAARANDLMALSRERIRDELLKLLALSDPAPTVAVMLAHRIVAPVMPEIADAARLAALVAAESAAGVAGVALRRLAALLPADPAVADAIAARLRLSNAERRRLVLAAGWPEPPPADLRALAYAIGAEEGIDRLLLRGEARAGDAARMLAAWRRPRLSLTGKDLIAAGLPPGPRVSAALREVEVRWIAAGFPGREDQDRIARDVLQMR